MRFPKGVDPEKAVPAYIAACQGYPIETVAETIRTFLRGGFEGSDKRFCPTPPELGDMVRRTGGQKRRADNVWPEDVDPVTAALKVFVPPTREAKRRVAEMMRKYEAGIPVNEEVARVWAKMEPFWQSGNPAYVGHTKATPPTSLPRIEADIMAELEKRRNDPIDVTPALLRKLAATEQQEEQT